MRTSPWRLLIVLASLPWTWAAAAQPASAGDEAVKQQAIYSSKGAERPEGYVIDRGLASYVEMMADGFQAELGRLGPGERWLDIGAGEGRAVIDYVKDWSRRGSAVALSLEDRRTPLWHQTAASSDAGRMRYVFGRAFREYSAKDLGRFQVITDLLGAFSYTPNPDVYMTRALEVLAEGGSLFTVLQDVHSASVDNKPYYKGAPFLTELRTPAGEEVNVCSWLRSISCVEVNCEFRSGWNPPIEVYRVRKVCAGVSVPALEPVHFTAGTPPERGFVVRLGNALKVHESAVISPSGTGPRPAVPVTSMRMEQ